MKLNRKVEIQINQVFNITESKCLFQSQMDTFNQMTYQGVKKRCC